MDCEADAFGYVGRGGVDVGDLGVVCALRFVHEGHDADAYTGFVETLCARGVRFHACEEADGGVEDGCEGGVVWEFGCPCCAHRASLGWYRC